jgi:hypothetical protein
MPERVLVDLTTGARHVQTKTADGEVRVEMHAHPLIEELAGKSWITFVEQTHVLCDDDPVADALGCMSLMVPGGTELEVDAEALGRIVEGSEHDDDLSGCYVPVVVRDPDFPVVQGIIPLGVLRKSANLMPKGRGPRANKAPSLCEHPLYRHDCRACFRAWWAGKAAVLAAQGKGE